MLRLRIAITKSSRVAEPVPIAREVALIERIHSEVLCAQSTSSAISSICETTLTKRIGNSPDFGKSAAKLRYSYNGASKSKMP